MRATFSYVERLFKVEQVKVKIIWDFSHQFFKLAKFNFKKKAACYFSTVALVNAQYLTCFYLRTLPIIGENS